MRPPYNYFVAENFQAEFVTWSSLSLTGLNSEFSFSLASYQNEAKENSQPYYSSIADWRRNRFMHFLEELAQSEMLTASFRFRTLVTDFIS